MGSTVDPTKTSPGSQDVSTSSSCDRRWPTSLMIGLMFLQLHTAPWLFAAELFPLPSPNQDKQQRSFAPAQLSQQDRDKIVHLAEKSKQISPDDQKRFRADIKNHRTNAIRNGQLNEAQFYDELLHKLD